MPTRLYFPATEAAPITNVAFDATWGTSAEATRFKLADTKGSSAITIGNQIGPWSSGNNACDRQLVSTRMDSGIVFTSGVTTFSGQIMVREYATTDNVDKIVLIVKVVSEDGLTIRASIRNIVNACTGAEFINNVTHRNQTYSNTMNGSYTTVLGDRLLVEIGLGDAAGTTPEGSFKWGENATDLPVNNTQTTDGAGWIEFSNTITFAGEIPFIPRPNPNTNQSVNRSNTY